MPVLAGPASLLLGRQPTLEVQAIQQLLMLMQ